MKRVEFPEDCIKIRDAMERVGYSVTLEQAEAFWKWRSELYSAGWLIIGGRVLEEDIKYVIDKFNSEFNDPNEPFRI